MDKLNVCLINDSFPPAIDGVANAVTNYAGIISEKYGTASVVTPYYPDADDSVFSFPVIRYPSIDTTKQVGYRTGIPFSAETMVKLEGENFDLIHSHCPVTSTLLARSLRDRIDRPIIFTYHTKFDIDIANAIHGKLLQEEATRLLAANISACDEVWTVSKGAGENLRSLGYEGDYIVMPNGVDFPKGRVSAELIEKATQGFDLPNGIPVYLFVGRMMWYKGIKISLDALKKLDESGKDFRMVFVGAGGDRGEIIEYTRKLGIDKKVFFSEPIRDRDLIRAWYCRADLFLFPSTFDTNGLVVREAAACSLASVLIRGSCAAEDIEDGVSGFLIDENADSMAAKLAELYDNMSAVKTVGENASELIYMSWDASVKNAVERYGIVKENHALGIYPAHEKLSDDFFHTAAKLMEASGRNRERQAERLSELRAEYLTLREEITGVDPLADLKQGVQELREDMIEQRIKLKRDISLEKKKLLDKLADFTSFSDRFR